MLVDAGADCLGDEAGLAWLAEESEAPLLVLGTACPDTIQVALNEGGHAWLPRDPALAHPAIPIAALRQMARLGELRRRARGLEDELQVSREHVDRLAGLLWAAAPGQGPGRWFTQRHVLERLEEELERTRRHGGPLSVVLGELDVGEGVPEEPDRLANWTAIQVGQSVRRCDVAGQYGLRGFMLVLPHAGSAEAEGACRRLRSVLQQPASRVGPAPPLHVYLGAASVAPDVTTAQGLLRRAEEQLEQAREARAEE